MSELPTALRMAAIGLAHGHIFDMAHALVGAGAELVAFHAEADDTGEQVATFAQAFPAAQRVNDRRAVLEDPGITIVLSASVPDRRAETAIAAMQHGKDVLVDKPATTTLQALAAIEQAQRASGRHFAVWFSERLAVRACTRASALVAAGAIGRVVHTLGLGPHRLGVLPRPPWFYQRARCGGILCDIASHQMEQFLHYTGSRSAQVLFAQVANLAHPEHPQLQDFAQAVLQGDGGQGTVRVDWLTAPGLPVWGDGRLVILGTEGHIELRKYIDLAGRPGANHLFLVDRLGTQHFDCSAEPLPFAAAWLADVRQRTQLALPQAHVFLATRLALQAQERAEAAGSGPPAGAGC